MPRKNVEGYFEDFDNPSRRDPDFMREAIPLPSDVMAGSRIVAKKDTGGRWTVVAFRNSNYQDAYWVTSENRSDIYKNLSTIVPKGRGDGKDWLEGLWYYGRVGPFGPDENLGEPQYREVGAFTSREKK